LNLWTLGEEQLSDFFTVSTGYHKKFDLWGYFLVPQLIAVMLATFPRFFSLTGGMLSDCREKITVGISYDFRQNRIF